MAFGVETKFWLYRTNREDEYCPTRVVRSYDVSKHDPVNPKNNENNWRVDDNIPQENIIAEEYKLDKNEKIYRISFWDDVSDRFDDSDPDSYTVTKGTEFLMRNGTYKKIENMKVGDLCMIGKNILPLRHFGEVRYITEELPTEKFAKFIIKDENNKPLQNTCLGNHVVVRL